MTKWLAIPVLLLLVPAAFPQKSDPKTEIVAPKTYKPLVITNSMELQMMLQRAVDETVQKYELKASDVAATLICFPSDPYKNGYTRADVNGEQPIYPASVVKLFYLAALERQLEDGKVKDTPELQRGLRDMIVESSNDATQYIVDVLTDTASGSELPQKKFEAWQFKRDRMNRYFASMGFANINVDQKTYCEDAYGVEQQSRRYNGENRNMLSTNATARLLAEIVLGNLNTEPRTRKMMELLRRDPFAEKKSLDESQAHDFIAKILIDRKIRNAKIWSKAGWTSKSRHDAAYVEIGTGVRFVLVIFTENHSALKEPIPAIAGKVIDAVLNVN
jgi:beta-lactamase class A